MKRFNIVNISVLHIVLIITFILAVSPVFSQNSSNTTDFHKGFSITANVGGGFCKYPAVSDLYPGVGTGVGMRYDFHRLWGVAAGIRYEDYFTIPRDIAIRNILIPVEMEFHLSHFYVRGGIFLGFGVNTWVAANAKEIFNIGSTLGLGGRINLSSKDLLTIGLHGALFEGFDYLYYEGHAPRLHHDIPRYSVMLNIGYEHRF